MENLNFYQVEYDAKEINDIISSLHDGNNGGGKWKKSSIESFDAYGIVGMTLKYELWIILFYLYCDFADSFEARP